MNTRHSLIDFLAARPGAGLPPGLAAEARQEDARRLSYFCITGTLGSFINAIGYYAAGNAPVAWLSISMGLFVLFMRQWILAGAGNSRVQPGLQVVATAIVVVVFIASVLTGGTASVASWFFGVVPMAVVFFISVRATLAWMLLCMGMVLLLWAVEGRWVDGMPHHPEPPVLQVAAHLTLILFSTALAVAARLVHDDYLHRLAKSLGALQQAKREAELARAEAEAASRAKSEFLAVMSHEIRTPLNGVIGLTQLMLKGPWDESKTHYLGLVAQSGETLLHLVNNLLDFSKIEAGQLELENVAFDPRQVADEALQLMKEVGRGKGLALTSELYLPPVVSGDPARLSQILLNLLSNAVKFTPQGSVTLRAFTLARTGWLRFEVADTGIGIAPVAQARLFQPFVQADSSMTRRFGGSGLGLSICKHLCAAMGGTLGLESRSGAGSTFWLELPLPEAVPAPEAEAIAAGADAARPFAGARVLLAEDNPVNQTVARGMLRHFGIEADIVADGQAAVEAVLARRYDLVLMDCNMPLMDGYTACRVIRAQEGGSRARGEAHPAEPYLPVVAMTAAAGEDDRTRCLEAGMDDYLPKPVRMAELQRVLEAWLPHAGAMRG
jgi:signal transduction histidine kinase/CheY-like chemotaxis protein